MWSVKDFRLTYVLLFFSCELIWLWSFFAHSEHNKGFAHSKGEFYNYFIFVISTYSNVIICNQLCSDVLLVSLITLFLWRVMLSCPLVMWLIWLHCTTHLKSIYLMELYTLLTGELYWETSRKKIIHFFCFKVSS